MTDLEIIVAEIREAEVPMNDALAGALERLEGLQAENAKLRTDAERYRWLVRQSGAYFFGVGKAADRSSVIDAAMREGK